MKNEKSIKLDAGILRSKRQVIMARRREIIDLLQCEVDRLLFSCEEGDLMLYDFEAMGHAYNSMLADHFHSVEQSLAVQKEKVMLRVTGFAKDVLDEVVAQVDLKSARKRDCNKACFALQSATQALVGNGQLPHFTKFDDAILLGQKEPIVLYNLILFLDVLARRDWGKQKGNDPDGYKRLLLRFIKLVPVGFAYVRRWRRSNMLQIPVFLAQLLQSLAATLHILRVLGMQPELPNSNQHAAPNSVANTDFTNQRRKNYHPSATFDTAGSSWVSSGGGSGMSGRARQPGIAETSQQSQPLAGWGQWDEEGDGGRDGEEEELSEYYSWGNGYCEEYLAQDLVLWLKICALVAQNLPLPACLADMVLLPPPEPSAVALAGAVREMRDTNNSSFHASAVSVAQRSSLLLNAAAASFASGRHQSGSAGAPVVRETSAFGSAETAQRVDSSGRGSRSRGVGMRKSTDFAAVIAYQSADDDELGRTIDVDEDKDGDYESNQEDGDLLDEMEEEQDVGFPLPPGVRSGMGAGVATDGEGSTVSHGWEAEAGVSHEVGVRPASLFGVQGSRGRPGEGSGSVDGGAGEGSGSVDGGADADGEESVDNEWGAAVEGALSYGGTSAHFSASVVMKGAAFLEDEDFAAARLDQQQHQVGRGSGDVVQGARTDGSSKTSGRGLGASATITAATSGAAVLQLHSVSTGYSQPSVPAGVVQGTGDGIFTGGSLSSASVSALVSSSVQGNNSEAEAVDPGGAGAGAVSSHSSDSSQPWRAMRPGSPSSSLAARRQQWACLSPEQRSHHRKQRRLRRVCRSLRKVFPV